MSPEEMRASIKATILKEFLPGEPEDALTDDLKLISEGILDSMASLKLVSFLEESFDVSIPAHHIDAEHLDTIELIARTVEENKK